MNENDLAIVEELMKRLKKFEVNHSSGLILIDTTFTQIAKSNLLLLKGFLENEGRGGYFIALDRPHQYMSYLLDMHDISHDRLWFIDTASPVSGQKKVKSKKVNFLEGPFHIEHLFNTFDLKADNQEGFPSISTSGFIMIDNISSILNYNSIEKVKKFIESFKKLVKDHSELIGSLVLDSDSYPELYELIESHIDMHITVDELKEDKNNG